MRTRLRLFGHGHANTQTRQPKLWPDGPEETGLTCSCGEPLVRTPVGYLSCPRGCGKLFEAANDPARWEGDDADLFGELPL